MRLFQAFIIIFFALHLNAQPFYFGSDLSYINEMEDCDVIYRVDGQEKDPYAIFNESGTNIVRLRLWHTPSWYDGLNEGKRYSDFSDVKKSILRAKQNNMKVLLDFHLSDNWADPSKQLVPEAWLSVVDDVHILKDSLYNYILRSLHDLYDEGLLPEMIQIGNETNKGILLSPEDNEDWVLDWDRNAILFNSAIAAVNDFELENDQEIQIVLHVAGPSNAEWLIDGFINSGVTDFDIIGISYYWAWHMPTDIVDAGDIVRTLKSIYPGKEVLIVETGYIWTNQWNDSASNIISETHPDYSPASPQNQRDWLVDMTQEMIDAGGLGVIYWEPAWVSSSCYTQWGQGSHQEHATFFDFQNNLLIPGGVEWMTHEYDIVLDAKEEKPTNSLQILTNSFSGDIKIKQLSDVKNLDYIVSDTAGVVVLEGAFSEKEVSFQLIDRPFGMYIVTAIESGKLIQSKKFLYSDK